MLKLGRYKLDVSNFDIASGVKNDYERCAISNALHRFFSKHSLNTCSYVHVSDGYDIIACNGKYTLDFMDYEKERLNDFIIKFDNGFEVKPDTFDVEIRQ